MGLVKPAASVIFSPSCRCRKRDRSKPIGADRQRRPWSPVLDDEREGQREEK